MKQKILCGLCLMVILGSVVSMVIRSKEPESPVQEAVWRMQSTLGRMAAEEVGRLLDHSGQVVLIAVDTGEFEMPYADAQKDAFIGAVNEEEGLEIIDIVLIDPADVMLSPVPGVPVDTYLDLLARYPEADALVSLAGAPQLTGAQMARLPKERPDMLVTEGLGFSTDLEPLLRSGVVQAAITPQGVLPSGNAPGPETDQEWFDRFYRILVP